MKKFNPGGNTGQVLYSKGDSQKAIFKRQVKKIPNKVMTLAKKQKFEANKQIERSRNSMNYPPQ